MCVCDKGGLFSGKESLCCSEMLLMSAVLNGKNELLNFGCLRVDKTVRACVCVCVCVCKQSLCVAHQCCNGAMMISS